jgi:O-methyltransferase involved in polyketide biosynthesis
LEKRPSEKTLLSDDEEVFMSDTSIQDLSGVSETLLITLYVRAMETQRPDALIRDEKAAALVRRMSREFDKIRRMPMRETDKTSLMMRHREFDRCARDFLAQHPDAVVVHIGCGLDARFDRVDNGRVEWYDLDFPNVIELHRKLLGGEGKRHHFLACSAFDEAWMDALNAHRPRAFLFLAEGFSMYCAEEQLKRLVLALRDRFPGAEFVFDAFSPLHIWISNLQLPAYQLDTRFRFGMWDGRKVEAWGDGIRLTGGLEPLRPARAANGPLLLDAPYPGHQQDHAHLPLPA